MPVAWLMKSLDGGVLLVLASQVFLNGKRPFLVFFGDGMLLKSGKP